MHLFRVHAYEKEFLGHRTYKSTSLMGNVKQFSGIVESIYLYPFQLQYMKAAIALHLCQHFLQLEFKFYATWYFCIHHCGFSLHDLVYVLMSLNAFTYVYWLFRLLFVNCLFKCFSFFYWAVWFFPYWIIEVLFYIWM